MYNGDNGDNPVLLNYGLVTRVFLTFILVLRLHEIYKCCVMVSFV